MDNTNIQMKDGRGIEAESPAGGGLLLPIELILQVVDAFAPDDAGAILAASHPSTRAFLAFTRVCHATHKVARGHLVRHCCYIDSSKRLSALQRRVSQAWRRPETLDHNEPLRSITSLYLGPFEHESLSYGTAVWVQGLSWHIGGTLRRLVMDMPLRSMAVEDNEWGTHVVLRHELFLGDWQNELAPAWTLWPNLRRLALYNVDMTAKFWHAVAAMPCLDTLVLTRADGLADVCIKTEYFSRGAQGSIKVLLVNVANGHEKRIQRQDWDAVDPTMRMRVMLCHVPASADGDVEPPELCQEYVKNRALSGRLWDWDGVLLKGAHLRADLTNPG